MNDSTVLSKLSQLVRYHILSSTTTAGSGHPSSSLSAVELMTVLFFGGFLKQDVSDFENATNDRIIFSKGHAAPLLYSLYAAAGVISSEELQTLRKFGSRLQGHPTPTLPFVDVSTGSLGQGLSVGVGMALGMSLKVESQKSKVFVLLGDSEFAEGQNYEALELAAHYKLANLIGILDVNRLGQRGETMLGWDIQRYEKRIKSFGWNTIIIENGHDIDEIISAYHRSPISNRQPPVAARQSPTMFIAKTMKGKGVSLLENKDGWHGKALSKEQLKQARKELGKIDLKVKGKISLPISQTSIRQLADKSQNENSKIKTIQSKLESFLPQPPVAARHSLVANPQSPLSTREAYGIALSEIAKENKHIVALDAETGNSTYADKLKQTAPDRFFEMFIAEQNMVSAALGFAKMGYIPFVSTFAAFLTRAFDQIRMMQYSVEISLNRLRSAKIGLNKKPISTDFNRFQPTLTINIVGSHSGVSIGEDGASQMGLEDIAMMRSINNSTVLYPSDAVSTAKLVEQMTRHPGINYLRTTRGKTPVIYNGTEEFPIGGFKIHSPVANPQSPYTLIIAAGITLHEALKAQKNLNVKNIKTVVVDLYSIKPLDSVSINRLIEKSKQVIIVEDHYEAGGIGEAILSIRQPPVANRCFTHLCVRKTPISGTPEELLAYEEIDAHAIEKTIQTLISSPSA